MPAIPWRRGERTPCALAHLARVARPVDLRSICDRRLRACCSIRLFLLWTSDSFFRSGLFRHAQKLEKSPEAVNAAQPVARRKIKTEWRFALCGRNPGAKSGHCANGGNGESMTLFTPFPPVQFSLLTPLSSIAPARRQGKAS